MEFFLIRQNTLAQLNEQAAKIEGVEPEKENAHNLTVRAQSLLDEAQKKLDEKIAADEKAARVEAKLLEIKVVPESVAALAQAPQQEIPQDDQDVLKRQEDATEVDIGKLQEKLGQDSTLTAIKTVANTICHNTQAANGSLGQPKTQLQQRTVIQFNTNPAKPPFFIGLTRQSGNWIWADGSYYDANVSGDIIDKGGDCAVVQQQSGFNVNIMSQSCTTAAYYTCQTRPCTTDFYCV
ncbi:unnamed protein product, partial [Mesorhabditis belari]|uniref:C-type lectin domain-containing protein n=1 Tax=Mesorhabditis belari TaxID=2138241 RepID=A0AAF3F7W2_9BILA